MHCSHCGNTVKYKEVSSYDEPLPETSNEYWDDFNRTVIIQCTICQKYTIKIINEGYRDAIEDESIHLTLDDWTQLYPNQHSVDLLIPDELRNLLESMKLNTNKSPELYIISMRKLLEELLKDKGYSQGSLAERIDRIALKEEWTYDLLKMAHYIRKVGNKEAHVFTKNSQKEQMKIIDLANYCIDYILDYLYIRKSRIIELSSLLEKTEIKDLIIKALEEIVIKDKYLLKENVNERSISHLLGKYLVKYFPRYNIDIEYNKNIGSASISNQKKFTTTKDKVQMNDLEGKSIYPDIIIHKRGTKKNYIVIEVKKSTASQVSKKRDHAKLRAFKKSCLNYQYAFFVEIPIGQDLKKYKTLKTCVVEIV